MRVCLEKFPINEGRMCEGRFGAVVLGLYFFVAVITHRLIAARLQRLQRFI